MTGLGNIDAIEFAIVEDMDEAYALWLNNEIDYCQVPPEGLLSHRVNYAQETIKVFEHWVYFFVFDVNSEPFDNVHVRRAFAAAFDNVSFVNDTLQGQGMPMTHLTPPGVFGAPPIDEIGVGYDLKFARAQLAEGGYSDCQGFPQVNLPIPRAVGKYLPEDVVRKWEENLNCPEGTINMLGDEAGDLFIDYHPEILYAAWGTDYPDANNGLGVILPCNNQLFLLYRTCNETDDLMYQAGIETDPDIRKELYYQIEEAFFGYDGEFPIAPVFWSVKYFANHTWLERTQALMGREAFYNWTLDMDAKLEVTGN